MEKFPKLYTGQIYIDDRGIVGFNNELNLSNIKRFYTITNHSENFIRAWHGHLYEEKYFLVTSGCAIIIACKLEIFGNNYKLSSERVKVTLSSELPSIFYIPGGYANGFKTLTKDTKLVIFSSATLQESKKDDIRINYNESEEKNMYPNNFEVAIR